VPGIFGLAITAGGEVFGACSLVWRNGERVGARFPSANELRERFEPAVSDPKPAEAAFAVNLLRRPQFAPDPAGRAGSQRVRHQHQFIGMGALQTLECAALEAFRPIRDRNRYHSRLAFGTTRSVDRQKLWIGFSPAPHDGKNSAGLKYLSVRLPTSKF